MMVPTGSHIPLHRDKPHSRLHQSSSQKQTLSYAISPVSFTQSFRFTGNIKSFFSFIGCQQIECPCIKCIMCLRESHFSLNPSLKLINLLQQVLTIGQTFKANRIICCKRIDTKLAIIRIGFDQKRVILTSQCPGFSLKPKKRTRQFPNLDIGRNVCRLSGL